jgi:hypothetical protein
LGQFNWTYLGDHGKKFNIGLYHGPRSGHLLIHCNTKIVQVDFGVRESTTYSFFLDEELCEIELERKGDQFFYRFNINKDIDTPRNRARKKAERKHWNQSLLFFGALIACALAFALWFTSRKFNHADSQKTELLAASGQETVGKVFLDISSTGELKMQYSFVAHGRSIESDWQALTSRLSPGGMPITSGDEFVVRFAQNRPYVNEIKLDQPSENQLQTYFQQTLNLHQDLHPELPSGRVRCLLSVAYEIKGVSGLADFYFQETSEEENPEHNKNSYLRLIRDIPFQKKSEEKCL